VRGEDELGVVIFIFLFSAAFTAIGFGMAHTTWQKWSVETGAAHYDQRTGAWTEGPAVTTK
jgi:hypothetical protein